MRGPDDSPYAGGEYHGVLLFTANYPFAPPGIKMFTPSGRFQVCTPTDMTASLLCDKMVTPTMSYPLICLSPSYLLLFCYSPTARFAVPFPTFIQAHGILPGPFPRFSQVYCHLCYQTK